jgi:hypothetical protein
MANAMRDDEAMRGNASYERYQKEFHGNKIVNDEDLLDDEDNAFMVSKAYHQSRANYNGGHQEEEINLKQGNSSSMHRQKAASHAAAVGSDEDDSHEFGDSFGHEWGR